MLAPGSIHIQEIPWQHSLSGAARLSVWRRRSPLCAAVPGLSSTYPPLTPRLGLGEFATSPEDWPTGRGSAIKTYYPASAIGSPKYRVCDLIQVILTSETVPVMFPVWREPSGLRYPPRSGLRIRLKTSYHRIFSFLTWFSIGSL